jgi:hypothetical protein
MLAKQSAAPDDAQIYRHHRSALYMVTLLKMGRNGAQVWGGAVSPGADRTPPPPRSSESGLRRTTNFKSKAAALLFLLHPLSPCLPSRTEPFLLPVHGEKARMRGPGGAARRGGRQHCRGGSSQHRHPPTLKKNFSPLHPPPSRAPLYSQPSLPSRGRARDRLGRVGRERRPRRSGPARHVSPGGKRSRSSRGSLSPPLRHYDRSAQ